MKHTTKDISSYTVKDYAEEIKQLLDDERDRTARILRRIDESMDVLMQSQQILRKIS